MTSKNMTMTTSLINRWTASISYNKKNIKKKKKQWFEKKLVSREPKLVSIAQPKEPCEGIYTYTYKYAYTYTYINTHT